MNRAPKIVSHRPLLFLAPPADEDSRLDIDFSNPSYQNDFSNTGFPVESLGDRIVFMDYGTSEKCYPDETEGTIPVLRMLNIKDGQFNLDKLVFLNLVSNEQYLLEKGDIVFNRTNSKPLVGKCAVITDQSETLFASYLIRVRVDTEFFHPEFVALYLLSSLGRNEIDKRSCGTANQYNISTAHIRSFQIPRPDLESQSLVLKRYKSILSACKKLIDRAATVECKRNEHLERMDMFFAESLGIDRFPQPWFGKIYHLSETALSDRLDVLGSNRDFTKQCKSAGCFLPFSEICEIDGTNSQIPLGPQKYLSIQELPGRCWEDISPSDVIVESTTSRKFFVKGDIAWAHLKPSILQGKAFIVPEECWGSHHFIRLATSDLSDDLRLIVWVYLKIAPIMRHLSNQCTGKSESQKDISAEQLASLPFPKLNKRQAKSLANLLRSSIDASEDLLIKSKELRARAKFVMDLARTDVCDLLNDQTYAKIVSAAEEVLDQNFSGGGGQ